MCIFRRSRSRYRLQPPFHYGAAGSIGAKGQRSFVFVILFHRVSQSRHRDPQSFLRIPPYAKA